MAYLDFSKSKGAVACLQLSFKPFNVQISHTEKKNILILMLKYKKNSRVNEQKTTFS